MSALVLARDAAGEFLLPAEMIAARFGLPEETLHGLMRRGLVASRVERGEGEDAGRFRLTVRCGNRRWRAVVDAEGRIADENFEMIASPGGMRKPPS